MRSGDYLTLDTIHQFAYCPRRMFLMYVQGRWEHNPYTVEGKATHRRVDKIDQVLPDIHSEGEEEGAPSIGDDPPEITRSVPLDSDILGLTAKLDLVSTAENNAVPVETKRGRVPNNEERSWEPERVQLMAQGLLLREQGYHCEYGVLYFAGSRTRVDVPFTDELEIRTRVLIEQTRVAIESPHEIPPTLEDSPKCYGCSLAGICLPDEVRTLTDESSKISKPTDIRRLFAARDDAVPFYVQVQGAQVGKRGKSLTVTKSDEKLASIGLKNVSQLVLCGNVFVTAQAVNMLCQEGIPIVHLTMGHWFCGITQGITLRNGYARAAQYKVADNPEACLAFAKEIVYAKAANQRTMLRRNANLTVPLCLKKMADVLKRIPEAVSIEYLLGLEGSLSASYFSNFSDLLTPRDFDAQWHFNKRNRRPPRDPVNALLSFGYAMLSKECTIALLAEGLDPWWGFYHKPRHGRPALALDLMEEFRPLIVDSAVITAINTGMVTQSQFDQSSSACLLNDKGRKAFIHAYEARLDHLFTHPVFEYRCSWRSIIRLQARLLGKWVHGELETYPGMTTR